MADGEKQLSINITTGTLVKGILLVVLAWVLFVLHELVLLVLTSVVIASAMEPAVSWVTRHRVPRVFAVLLVYAVLILFLTGLFYAFAPPLLEEVSGLLQQLPALASAFDTSLQFSPFPVGGENGFSLERVIADIEHTIGNTSEGFFRSLSAIFGGVLGFVLVLVFSFYFSVQETGVDDFLRIVTPRRYEEKIINLWKRSQKKIGLWMQGQLLLAVIVGVLVFLGLTILGVRYALILAIVAALFELIPVFGPILSAIPAVAIGFLDGGTGLALVVLGLFIIIQQFENHLIYPLVVTKVVGVPPLLVILALIAGAQLAGVLGIILSVPVAAVIQELVHDIEAGRRKRKELEHA